MSAALLNDHYFVLNIITSAGAYVKEFVHGDLGRTFPSISSLISSPVGALYYIETGKMVA
jgi:tRNA pseudouridine synthase 10